MSTCSCAGSCACTFAGTCAGTCAGSRAGTWCWYLYNFYISLRMRKRIQFTVFLCLFPKHSSRQLLIPPSSSCTSFEQRPFLLFRFWAFVDERELPRQGHMLPLCSIAYYLVLLACTIHRSVAEVKFENIHSQDHKQL